jgi:hypothetical protein
MQWKTLIEECNRLEYDEIFTAFFPNKDKEENVFDVEPWDTEYLKMMGKLFGGATSYPAKGSYRKIKETGEIEEKVMVEQTRMVVCFIKEIDFSEIALKEVSDFLKRFKSETNQESVAFVIGDAMYFL